MFLAEVLSLLALGLSSPVDADFEAEDDKIVLL